MTSLKLVQRILVFGTTSRKWLLGYFMGLSGRVNVFPYYKCGDWGTENLGVLARSRGMAGKAEQVRYCQRHSPDRQLWLGASLTALPHFYRAALTAYTLPTNCPPSSFFPSSPSPYLFFPSSFPSFLPPFPLSSTDLRPPMQLQKQCSHRCFPHLGVYILENPNTKILKDVETSALSLKPLLTVIT